MEIVLVAPSGLRAQRKGKWLCSVAPGLTVYLKDPPSGDQMIAAVKVYQTVCPPEKRLWIAGTRSPGFAKWNERSGQRIFSEHVTLMNRRRDHGVSIWDGEIEDTWSFTIRGVPVDSEQPRASFCQISFPTGVDLNAIVHVATGLANVLPFVSGHAGFTSLFDAEHKFDAFVQIYAWAKHHPGLEVEDLNETLPFVLDAMKGANWLTLVGNQLWNRLPSPPVFSPAVRIRKQTYGVVVQAGDAPVLGRRNAADTPALYVEVERALAPIKLVEHGEFAGRFADQKATMPWLKRFLRPDEW